MAQYIDIYDYDFLLGASAMAQQEALYAVANASSLSAVGTVNQIVGFDAAGNPVAKDVGGDSNGAGLAFSGDTLTATLPQNLKTTGAPTFAGLTLSGLTADRLLFSNASKAVTSSALTYDSVNIIVGNLNSLDFAAPLTPNPVQPGRLQWNDQDGTLDLGVKGGNVTLQIGQEQLARVVNKTGGNLLEAQYKVVRINEAQGQRIGVALAQANSEGNSTDIIGIVTEDIPVNQEGFVTVHGVVRDIDTTGALQGETWADGDVLYLSPTIPGGLTKSKPKAPNHLIMMAYVAYAHSQHGKIFVAIQSSWETHELHDVQFGETAPAAGSLLIRDATVGVWKPALLQAGANIALSFSDGAISIASTAAGVTPGNKGDITVDAVTGAWTINAGAVLNADLASMANGTIKARITTGAGAPEDATITQVLDLAAGGTAAQGDILYRTGSTWTRLPAGTVGQYLQTAGTANPPSWADVTGVTPGNKGDISVDAVTNAWTINNDAVTYAKIQNVTDNRLLGRSAGTNGDAQEITVGTGLTLSSGQLRGGREVLTADRTYYVRTDGSDSNNGLTDSAGGAFLTIQKAVDVAGSIDPSIYDITIQVKPGTYAGFVRMVSMVMIKNLFVKGDTRVLAGMSYVENSGSRVPVWQGTTNLGGYAGVGNVTITRTTTTRLTITASTTNPNFSGGGWGAGDKILVYSGHSANTFTEYTLSAVGATTLDISSGSFPVIADGYMVTFVPNVKVAPTTVVPTGTLATFSAVNTLQAYIIGFEILPTTNTTGTGSVTARDCVAPQANAELNVHNCLLNLNGGAGNSGINGANTKVGNYATDVLPYPLTVVNGGWGLVVQQNGLSIVRYIRAAKLTYNCAAGYDRSYLDILGSVGIKCGTTFLASRNAYLDARSTVSLGQITDDYDPNPKTINSTAGSADLSYILT